MRNGSCIESPIFFSIFFLLFFHSYLTNRKQFIKCHDQNTDLEILRCGVPQVSILGPLLFLIYEYIVYDLKNSTKLLDPFMFANKNMKDLKQSIKNYTMLTKVKYLFFHKPSACDSIPLRLPTITFNSIEIKRESSVTFLGVIIDKNITWNKHIELVENKILKNIGILPRASHYLHKKSLKSIYFSFIHNYVNYCNMALTSASRTKLDKILKKQKHAVRIIYNKDKFTYLKPLMRDMKALNVYQTNIFQVLKFMYKSKHNLNPTQQGFLEGILNNQKQLPKPLVLPFLPVGQRFGIITHINLKKKYLCLHFFIN